MASLRCPAVECMMTYSLAVASWLTRSFSQAVMLSLMTVSAYFPSAAFLSTRIAKFEIFPAVYVKASFLLNLYGTPPIVMLNIVVPASTVCGTAMARHSLPVFAGMVAVCSTPPFVLTVPSARFMLASRTRFATSTCFSVAAHSPSAKPSPSTSVTRAHAMR